jgi:alpha/beta superfamily hydrolase
VDAHTEPLSLTTADDVTLEGEAVVPDGATAAVVLCHPHPVQGGSMRSLVTSELFTQLPKHDVAVVRFNFRGVEGSGGEHGGGVAEQLDVVAALDAMAERVPEHRPIVAGWSFGADVSLAVTDARIAAWFAIAPPLRVLPADAFVAGADPRPKLLAVPERDQFDPPPEARQRTEGWSNTTLEVVAGADHFLVGKTARLTELLLAFAGALNSAER